MYSPPPPLKKKLCVGGGGGGGGRPTHPNPLSYAIVLGMVVDGSEAYYHWYFYGHPPFTS